MNPFASCFVRPEKNVYRFDRDAVIDIARREEFIETLMSTLRTQRCAAIVGAHGTGKSTLLRSIESDLRIQFDHVRYSTFTSDKRHSHRELLSNLGSIETSRVSSTCLIVDGYEQLRWWHRWALVRVVKQRKLTSLLVTCHQPSRLIQTCIETRWDESMARFLTDEKLHELPEATRRKLWDGFENRLKDANPESRNLREMWFSMYDEFEIIRHQERQPS